jgi:hypothetical protein
MTMLGRFGDSRLEKGGPFCVKVRHYPDGTPMRFSMAKGDWAAATPGQGNRRNQGPRKTAALTTVPQENKTRSSGDLTRYQNRPS